MNHWFGNLKFRIERLQGYLTIPSTAITVLASFSILGISKWWLMCGIPLLYAVHMIDKRWIYPHQAKRMYVDNPEWSDLMKMVREIKEKN